MSEFYTLDRRKPVAVFCPVRLVEDTPKQIVVRTPRGKELRFWKRNMTEVCNVDMRLGSGDLPVEGVLMRLSDEAKAA